MKHFISMICKERPVGTANNAMINAYLEDQLFSMGFNVQSLPFDCIHWESDVSQLNTENETFDIMPSPFSEGFEGDGKLVFADTICGLELLDCTGAILLLCGGLADTHTLNDTLGCIDTNLVLPIASYIETLIHTFDKE